MPEIIGLNRGHFSHRTLNKKFLTVLSLSTIRSFKINNRIK